MRILRWIACSLVVLTASVAAQPQRDLTVEQMAVENRFALVIGNSGYKESPLKNPVNDARAMSQALEKIGFEVNAQFDINQIQMRRAIRAFGKRIKEERGVGLFYFAGHGMQVNGRNFLIPLGTEIKEEDEVLSQAVDASEVLRKMNTAGNRVNVVILDACRNNPFERSFRSASRGLAEMNTPIGTVLAYATSPGSVAADGTGDNGLYTEALLEQLNQPNQKVEDMFKQVSKLVMKGSEGQQMPWVHSSLLGDFYFAMEEPNTAPEAHAGIDQQIRVNRTVLLDGSQSRDAEDNALDYNWRQLEGPAVDLFDADTAAPRFLPQHEGIYRFELVVSDEQTHSVPAYVDIHVSAKNAVPTAVVQTGQKVRIGQQVTLDGMDSRDADGDPLEFKWVQAAGPSVVLADAGTATPRFIAAQEGEYRFQLVVNDGQHDSAPAEVRVRSEQAKPSRWKWWVAGAVGVGAAAVVLKPGPDTPPSGKADIQFSIPVP